MPDVERMEAVTKWTEAGKNLFGLLRDAALFTLLILLVGCPALINDRLKSTGLSSLEGPGFKWQREAQEAKQEGLAAVTQVEQVKQAANETIARVDRIVAENPELAPQVAPIRNSLRRTTSRLEVASNQLESAVVRQQEILDEAAPAANPITGWVLEQFLRVEGDVEPGARAETAPMTLNVRSGAGPTNPVVAILPRETLVRIEEVGTGSSAGWVLIDRIEP